MNVKQRHKEYLYILFVAGVLALNYPLLSLFNHLLLPFGIPLLFLYLFLSWLAIIVALAVIMERTDNKPEH